MKIKIKILILNLIAVPQGVSTISLSLSGDICLRAAFRKSAKYQRVEERRHCCIYRDLCQVRLTGWLTSCQADSLRLSGCLHKQQQTPTATFLPVHTSPLPSPQHSCVMQIPGNWLYKAFSRICACKSPKFLPITPGACSGFTRAHARHSP